MRNLLSCVIPRAAGGLMLRKLEIKGDKKWRIWFGFYWIRREEEFWGWKCDEILWKIQLKELDNENSCLGFKSPTGSKIPCCKFLKP